MYGKYCIFFLKLLMTIFEDIIEGNRVIYSNYPDFLINKEIILRVQR
jgi:hypothetical protein